MKFYFTKTYPFIKRIFKNKIWDIPNNNNTIYLTFDDGPIPIITPWVLNLLREENIKATFFCIGDNVKKNNNIYQQILNEGHKIGNHTNNHLNGWKTNTNLYIQNTIVCKDILVQEKDLLFRPPYGKISNSQCKKILSLGYKIIMWDVLSADFDQTISPEDCLQNVIKNVTSGSIIVFHDSIKAKKNLEYTLPKAIKILKEKGFVFDKL